MSEALSARCVLACGHNLELLGIVTFGSKLGDLSVVSLCAISLLLSLPLLMVTLNGVCLCSWSHQMESSGGYLRRFVTHGHMSSFGCSDVNMPNYEEVIENSQIPSRR